jgi:ABC-2 type transport system permease protein
MNLRGFYTLFYKEILRFGKVAFQTLMAPVVTSLLYLLVFAHVLEGRVSVFEGVDYGAFLIPGLMMMSVIQNAFANSSSSIIQSKVTGNIVFVLLTPLSYLEFYLAFVLAAAVRGMTVAVGVFAVGVIFVDLSIQHIGTVLLFALLSSTILGTGGIIAGIWAEKFDQLAGAQNFVIMPLSFLSGVFYSIHSLPEFWQQASRFNPFFYMIDGFRYGFFAQSDVPVATSLSILVVCQLVLAAVTIQMLRSGYRLRN